MNISKSVKVILLGGLSMTVLSGCITVKPWERGTLAKPEMQLVADPAGNAMDEHIYFSKEASVGGAGVGGGGCGCN